jgi:MFS family permease
LIRATVARIEAARRRLPENVRILGWVSLANDAASELAYPIVPLFLTITLGAPVAAVGIVEGIAEAIATGVRLLSGWLSDRMGDRRRPWIVGGYAASTAARALLAAAPAWGWVLGARVVDRLGKGARSTPRDALIRDSTPREMYGTSFGYHRAMDTAGAIVGPLVAVIMLAAAVSLRTILWVAFAVGLLVLVVLRRIREAPVSARQKSGVAIKREPLSTGFWAALSVWVVFSLGNSSDAFLILRARDLGLAVLLVVLAYAIYNVVYASLSWPLGALSDRRRRGLVIGGGLFVFALVYLGFAVADASWAVWPLFAFYGIYIAATEGVARAWVADQLNDRSAVGTAYGIFFAATAGAALVASVVAGVLWTYVSPRAPFYLGAATAAAALVLLLAYSAYAAAEARIVRALLAGGAILCVAGAIAAAVEHGRIADAFRTTRAEALPAALVRGCTAEPSARLARADLPRGFPKPTGVVYAAQRRAGPTTIVSGFFRGGVAAAKRDYVERFPSAGYDVLRSELDPADAEVAFAGHDTTGQVKLTQECRDRTHVAITVRPE